MLENIVIKGASENNLQNVDVTFPRNKLVVFTGVSGSGKSSLAFGTIFAEGKRRFMESLSSYARQFMGQMQKPAVEYIEGLSPAISIDQKTTSQNPRSTVGTVTEIYDYLRLLYARIGDAHCHNCGKPVHRQTVDQIAEQITRDYDGEMIMIESPVVRGKKGSFEREMDAWKRSGIVRVRVDGSMYRLDDEVVTLDKNIRHDISLVLDRVTVATDEATRINEALESALRHSDGLVTIVHGDDAKTLSNKYACLDCGISIEDLEPRNFSFNSPFGACGGCSGLGFTMEIDPKAVIPNTALALNEGAVTASGWGGDGKISHMMFTAFAKQFKFDISTPVAKLPKEVVHKLLYGMEEKLAYEYNNYAGFELSYNGKFEGIIGNLMRRYRETNSEYIKQEIGKMMINQTCSSCKGRRLKPEVLAVRVGGLNISEVTGMPVRKSLEFFEGLKLDTVKETISHAITKEIRARIKFLVDVGLHYLTLARSSDSLSGGESQRIRLATQIGSGLVGVLYILDEPSIGLHQRDNQKLIQTLFRLRDLGNTLVVVEHDEETMEVADFIVDIGPRAGKGGGRIVATGTLDEIKANEESLTGQYLSGKRKIEAPKEYRKGDGRFVEIVGATENNLKNVSVKIPVGLLTAVTGVSGSGKSSLINKILFPALYNIYNKSNKRVGSHEKIVGANHFDKVIDIDQSPIGRTPRSNPATYTGVWTPIRELFAGTRDAKERGYEVGRFSFNVRGGRCDACEGDGVKKIEMHFLPDVYVQCEVCKGKRFNRETLEVKFKGKNIHDVLEMTVEEGVEFFENIPAVRRKMQTLYDVGLGYIRLGQSATTLSGGEAQRIKLATYLSKQASSKTIYILDEPTTGLHAYDTHKLIGILQRLVGNGSTVVVIEHNLDVIKVADHIIDIGPDGGEDGGMVIATGTPKEIAKSKESATGVFLQKMIEQTV